MQADGSTKRRYLKKKKVQNVVLELREDTGDVLRLCVPASYLVSPRIRCLDEKHENNSSNRQTFRNRTNSMIHSGSFGWCRRNRSQGKNRVQSIVMCLLSLKHRITTVYQTKIRFVWTNDKQKEKSKHEPSLQQEFHGRGANSDPRYASRFYLQVGLSSYSFWGNLFFT
jgi:hypothetical protein